MSVQILTDRDEGYKCLFCNTTMWAFGGIFYAEENVEDFLEWLPKDPREYKDKDLENKIFEWRNIKEIKDDNQIEKLPEGYIDEHNNIGFALEKINKIIDRLNPLLKGDE